MQVVVNWKEEAKEKWETKIELKKKMNSKNDEGNLLKRGITEMREK
jgi:hypothetical protein